LLFYHGLRDRETAGIMPVYPGLRRPVAQFCQIFLFFGQKADKMDQRQFAAALRTALMQLDDLHSLARNPLLAFVPSAGSSPSPIALQRLLLDAIDTLRTAEGASSTRFYDVLYYRYQEQLNQDEVAFQLGVSVRQLRREQTNAILFLADQLWEHLAVAEQTNHLQPGATITPGNERAIQQEMAWLRGELRPEPSIVATEVRKALADAATLAQRYAVRFQVGALLSSHQAAAPPLVLRQAILIVLTSLIPRTGGRTLMLSSSESAGELKLTLQSEPTGGTQLTDSDLLSAIETATQLLTPFSGRVIWQGDQAAIVLTTPSLAGTPILLIDDNPDAHQLFRRYVENTRFRLITAAHRPEAMSIVEQMPVHGLVLDIMMPTVDGWDLLSQWRHHPATQTIPVAVCTILPQKELAQVLGAALFIQKPVAQETFLRALDELAALMARASC
jgi:CheY-like chemotaxis protein